MRIVVSFAAGLFALTTSAFAQEAPPTSPAPALTADASAQNATGSAHITLDDAFRLALQRNHALASLLDFLDLERRYRANQLAYRQSLANYMLALEQLRQAVGTRNFP